MRLLIWDFDGTLAHRDGMWSGALCEVAASLSPGRTLTIEQFRPFLSSGFPWHYPETVNQPNLDPDTWWQRLKPIFFSAYQEVGFDAATATMLASHVRAHFTDPRGWRLFDDAPPTLAELKRRGWRHVILSNHVPELAEIVSALGLSNFIDRIFCSAATGYEKPHIEAFRQVLRAYPDRESVIMVGDSLENDVRGASSAGIRAILVRSESAEPCERYSDLWSLPASVDPDRTAAGRDG